MKKNVAVGLLICFISAVSSAVTVQGIDLDFVTIGNAGNVADSAGYGAVGYEYQIGKYEITASQWSTINTAASIGGGPLWGGDQPMANVDWYQAAQFCNYLTTGNKHTGVYTFTEFGLLTSIMDHETAGSTFGRAYFLPTEDEWFKAAYYTGSDYSLYANGTDTDPIPGTDTNYALAITESPWDVGSGSKEQNDTYDMMGNVWEWNETQIDSNRGVRGGSYTSFDLDLSTMSRFSFDPRLCVPDIGFRVASIPEPMTLSLLALGGLLMRKRK